MLLCQSVASFHWRTSCFGFPMWLLPYMLSHTSGAQLNPFANDLTHWIVWITFLQHTDPLLPHYRTPAFTFTCGTFATLDSNILSSCGKLLGWITVHTANDFSKTHVSHDVFRKIFHYNVDQIIIFSLKAPPVVGLKLSKSSRSAM